MTDAPPRLTRVAAYAVATDGDAILLCRLAPGATRDRDGWWTLPGGGIDHGEHPRDAALRELTEETGLVGEVVELLDVGSWHRFFPAWGELPDTDFHSVQVIYRVAITGGTLRPEVGGTSDQCRWVRHDELAALSLVELVTGILPRAFDASVHR